MILCPTYLKIVSYLQNGANNTSPIGFTGLFWESDVTLGQMGLTPKVWRKSELLAGFSPAGTGTEQLTVQDASLTMNGVMQPSLWSCSGAVFPLLWLWMAILKRVRESPHSSLVGCAHASAVVRHEGGFHFCSFILLSFSTVSRFLPQFDTVLSRMGDRVLFFEKLSFRLSGYSGLNRFRIGVSSSDVKGALFCHCCVVGREPVCSGLSGCPSWRWLTFTWLPGTLVLPTFPSFLFFLLFCLFCFQTGKSRTLSSKRTRYPPHTTFVLLGEFVSQRHFTLLSCKMDIDIIN